MGISTRGMAPRRLRFCLASQAELWLVRRRSWRGQQPGGADASWRSLLRPGARTDWWSTAGVGRMCLLVAAVGLIGAEFTIQTIGVTRVFVPTDLTFMGLSREQLGAINPRLVPLIAHDCAGFGGGVATAGLLVLACVWCGRPSRSLWQALLLAGLAGLDDRHRNPSDHRVYRCRASCTGRGGAVLFFVGLVLSWSSMCGSSQVES